MVVSDQNQLDRGESSPTHSHFIQIDALKTWSSIHQPHSHVLMLITGGADATARGTQSTQRQPNTEREARGRRSMPESQPPPGADADVDAGVVVEKRNLPGDQ